MTDYISEAVETAHAFSALDTTKAETLDAIRQYAANRLNQFEDVPAPMFEAFLEMLDEGRAELLETVPDSEGTPGDLVGSLLISLYVAYRAKANDSTLKTRMLADDIFHVLMRAMEPLEAELRKEVANG